MFGVHFFNCYFVKLVLFVSNVDWIDSFIFSIKSSKFTSLGEIGLCISSLKETPKDRGKLPFFTIFHELLMVMGTIWAEGADFNKIFNPVLWKYFNSPFRLRVPSGKMTAERLCFS